MSVFNKCDGYECTNFEWDCTVYSIDYCDADIIKKLIPNQINEPYEHICESCMKYVNEEYPKDKPLLIVNDYGYACVADEYKELPK